MNPHYTLTAQNKCTVSQIVSLLLESPSFHSSCLQLCQWKPIEVWFPVINMTESLQFSADNIGFLWLFMPFSFLLLLCIYFFPGNFILFLSLFPLLLSLEPTQIPTPSTSPFHISQRLFFVPDNNRNEAMTAQGDFIQSSIFQTDSKHSLVMSNTISALRNKKRLVWCG